MVSSEIEGHDEKMVVEAMETWEREFSAKTHDAIVELYAEDASLWGTLSPRRRADPESIRDYFEQAFIFTDRKVTFHDSSIRCYGNLAINSGTYTFSWVKDGKKLVIPSRYSFTYTKRNEHWLIAEHHSSPMPSE
jgi:hypothetical protein